MSTPPLEAGELVDGFRLDALIHDGGLASIWRVLRSGDAPLNIVAFEVERMILPRLSGVHVPRFVAAGDFERP